MNQDKMYLINQLFNNKTIRTVWDKEQEKQLKKVNYKYLIHFYFFIKNYIIY